MSDYRPTIEAVEYYRRVLEDGLDQLDRITERLPPDERAGFKKAVSFLRYDTLGDEKGCVITAFDRRGPKILAALTPPAPMEVE